MLAGFPDDLADEGAGAGPASLVGLEIAREQRLDRAPIRPRRGRTTRRWRPTAALPRAARERGPSQADTARRRVGDQAAEGERP